MTARWQVFAAPAHVTNEFRFTSWPGTFEEFLRAGVDSLNREW
jgi:hypothetical protein